MKLIKINKNKLLIILLIFMSFFLYSCGGEEEDNYATTEFNGLYRYKSAYATVGCTEQEPNYKENIESELVQPYFIIEGQKTGFGEEINLLQFYCEDRKFDSCMREDEYGNNLANILAKGVDGAWGFLPKVEVSYDYRRKICVFKKTVITEYRLESDFLQIKTDLYSYEDKDLSVSDCKINAVNQTDFKCISKRKYSTKRELISEKDQKVFDEKENNPEN